MTQPEPPYSAPGPMPVAEYLEPEHSPRPSNRIVVLTAGVVLVLAAAAAGSWWVLGRGSDDGYTLPLAQAVTEEPELDWSWKATDSLGAVVALGDDTFVTDGGEVVALDADGEERWTTSVEDVGYITTDPRHDDLLLAAGGEESSVTAISVEDGDELWTAEGDLAVWADDYVLTNSDEELARVDLGDGDQTWSVDSGGVAGASPDAAYVVEDDQLRKLSLEDGDEEWSVDLGLDLGDFGSIVVADGYAVVSGDTEVAAFDGGNGDELWTADTGPDGASIGLMSSTRVFVAPDDYESQDELHVRVYDADGEVGEIEAGSSYFWALPVRSGGDTYAFDFSEGVFYDEELDRVGRTHESPMALVDGGVYQLEEGELSYYRVGDKEPAWTSADDFAEEAFLGAGDRRVYVVDGDELRSYG